MDTAPSPWPRRTALAYVALVLLCWVVVIAAPFWHGAEALVVAVGLPWSILLLDLGALGLFSFFLAGLVNAGVLYLLLGGWRRVAMLRGRWSSLPPAA